ncbi:hypothetical protein, partial [Mycobacterium marinum]|uniref:hypothetical protein n=1 Tax=Mycobacterium marinum TaxID=1781 RepID=UPI0021C320BF
RDPHPHIIKQRRTTAKTITPLWGPLSQQPLHHTKNDQGPPAHHSPPTQPTRTIGDLLFHRHARFWR